jgi:hypothetical protein
MVVLVVETQTQILLEALAEQTAVAAEEPVPTLVDLAVTVDLA